jgi:hypothetical protein
MTQHIILEYEMMAQRRRGMQADKRHQRIGPVSTPDAVQVAVRRWPQTANDWPSDRREYWNRYTRSSWGQAPGCVGSFNLPRDGRFLNVLKKRQDKWKTENANRLVNRSFTPDKIRREPCTVIGASSLSGLRSLADGNPDYAPVVDFSNCLSPYTPR